MAEYMSCCDCVITKAGPGTIAEALACGLPIVLNGALVDSKQRYLLLIFLHRLYTLPGGREHPVRSRKQSWHIQ